jgi:deazaflavin-dependent oxidoreductase (nitroreductase family)
MSFVERMPLLVWRLMRLPPRGLYALGLGRLIGRRILLLTTHGRRTGKLRTTPLQYEEVDGAYYVASARGKTADWLRNLAAFPEVDVRVGARCFKARAELITDPLRIADFLQFRLQRHPMMVGLILRAGGLSRAPGRADLERYAAQRALVVLTPTA